MDDIPGSQVAVREERNGTESAKIKAKTKDLTLVLYTGYVSIVVLCVYVWYLEDYRR